MRKRKCSTNEEINNVYTVETIYKKKSRNNKEPLYFIKWKDWDDKYNTWEPLSNILDHSLIETFEDEIREKQKLRKEANKNKVNDSNKLDYESDVKSVLENEKDPLVEDVQISDVERVEKDKEEKLPDLDVDAVSRPKICIKIPKYRIHPPQSSTIRSSLSKESNSPEIENPRRLTNESDDDRLFLCRLSPIYLSKESDLNKPIKNESRRHSKSPKKEHGHKVTKKHLSKLDKQIRKPRKLLSINEYSAAIKMKKKHHKKSKHSKHRSENKVFQSIVDSATPILCSDEKSSPNLDTNKSHEEKPSVPFVTKNAESWPKSQARVRVEKDNKLTSNTFKFHSETTVTDVTVNGLCVTVKELSYEDFVSDCLPRYQTVRLPKDSDWNDRYLGRCTDTHDEDEIDDDDEGGDNDGDDHIATERSITEENINKQKLLDKFEEHIIQGLRPPSRPRSVDSYKNIMDKTMFGISRNSFTETITASKTVDLPFIDEGSVMKTSHDFVKSPLKIIVDDCEEVDVVGGIESENSYMSSIQSTRTTFTTQLRQADRLSTQSPVSSMIQSLLHSYHYNSSMDMPPLQAAPWVQSPSKSGDRPSNQSFDLPFVTSSQHFLGRSSSLDPTLLKYTQSGVPLSYYQQSSNFLSNLYTTTNGEETPIDLSFK